MASSSLEPMRRKRTSWRPALVSKIHFPALFTSGIGSGQSSLPTEMMARLEFLGSMATSFFSRALTANAMALFLSWTGSSEDTKSSPSGPRISLGQVRQSFPSLELMLRRLLWVLQTLSALAEMVWLPAFRIAALAKTLPQYNPRRLARALGGFSTRIYSLAVTSYASPCSWI